MGEPTSPKPTAAIWLHRWAVLTVLATLPLLFLGAEVTTKRVGMTDPVWPTHPLYLILEGTGLERGLGFLIEHSHRLAGWTVGLCSIILAVLAWRWEPRGFVRGLAFAVLGGVVVQGLLGGFRVRLHDLLGPDLALVHGCFGQLVFALLVSVAICTSPRWRAVDDTTESTDATEPLQLRRGTLIIVGLLLTQLILGAFVRHRLFPLAQRGHLLVAFTVLAGIVWLATTALTDPASNPNVRRAVKLMLALVVVQLMLGVEAWMIRAPNLALGSDVIVSEPAVSLLSRDVVRSLHVLVGAILLSSGVVAALEAHRSSIARLIHIPSARRLEEAA
jgi:heme a synthase